ncbi:capsule assembly Wzi family protein, partial [Rhodoferax sp.]|uniref:capsule assembly Wzi family protein n=1 Tax=Rhodoferax sp. TaxID=50421 RepID=UPI001A0364CD
VYGQMMGEDEAGAFPAKKAWLFGLDATSRFFESNQQWFIEYSDTLANGMFGDGIANVSYEHSNWTTGNRYLGRNQASTFEGDSRNLTLGLFNFFPNGHNLGLSVAYAELNVNNAPVRATITDPDITYYIPAEKTDILFFNISYGMQFGSGWLNLGLQLQDDNFLRASGGKQEQIAVGASYKYRF